MSDTIYWQLHTVVSRLSGAAAMVLVFLSLSLSQEVMAQDTCKALDEDFKDGKYQGQCKAGLAEGVGTVVPNAVGGTRFEGRFIAGARQGQGRITYFNGDVYDGQWKDDKRWGFGVYSYGVASPWAGDRYEGEWVADKMDGAGTYRWSIGDSYSGAWQDGQQVGDATGWQARRAAYLKAFVLALPTTQSHVCAASRAPGDPHINATGYVRAQTDDRILVEAFGGAAPSWQSVSLWRPCSKKN